MTAPLTSLQIFCPLGTTLSVLLLLGDGRGWLGTEVLEALRNPLLVALNVVLCGGTEAGEVVGAGKTFVVE